MTSRSSFFGQNGSGSSPKSAEECFCPLAALIANVRNVVDARGKSDGLCLEKPHP